VALRVLEVGEGGEDAAVVLIVGGRGKLGEDVADVGLDVLGGKPDKRSVGCDRRASAATTDIGLPTLPR
jgi:hypothetical protein